MLQQTIIEAGELVEAMPAMRGAGLARARLHQGEREHLVALDAELSMSEFNLDRARKDIGAEALEERAEIEALRRERVAPAESLAGAEEDLANLPLRITARQQDLDAACKVGDLGLDPLIAALKRTKSGTLAPEDAVAVIDHFENTLAASLERVLRARAALRAAENDALHRRGSIEGRIVRARSEINRIDARIAKLAPIVEVDDRRQAAARAEIDSKVRDLQEQRAHVQGQLAALGR